MKINLTLDGEPNLIKRALARAIYATMADPSYAAAWTQAEQAVETAVKNGGVDILLGEVTEKRVLANAGCL